MVKWRQLLSGIGAVALGVAGARGQAVGDQEMQAIAEAHAAMANPKAPMMPIGGRFIIVDGDVVFQPIDLPIVNSGFANDADVTGPLKPLVEKLKSTEYSEREDASRAMLRLPPGRLGEVVEALSHETDAEAIERLTQAAAHLYLKPRTLLKTRASLFGVWHMQPNLSLLGMKFRMDPVKLAPADAETTMTVMVTEIQVGFPALQTLRNGDRIVAIGGVGFPPNLPPDDSSYFRSRVAVLWPGSVVPMMVLREGKLVEVGVQVAGLPLDGPASPDAMVQMRAAALNAFMATLKTGDKSQAMMTISPTEAQPRTVYYGGTLLIGGQKLIGEEEVVVPPGFIDQGNIDFQGAEPENRIPPAANGPPTSMPKMP